MKFFKIILFLIISTYSTWVFAQNSVSPKFVEEISSLSIKLAELEAKKTVLDFVATIAAAKLEKPLNASNDLSELQKIENEIVLAIKDQVAPSIFDEKIATLNQENQKLKDEIKTKKTEYFKLLDTIPTLEKEFGFSYGSTNFRSPEGNSGAYFLGTILVTIFMILFIAKIKVISIRRRWRAMEPERTILFRWLGFGWLLPILICSCQSGKTIEIDFFNLNKIMEVEKKTLEDKLKKQRLSVDNASLDFEKKIQSEPTIEPLLLKCAEYLEGFKYGVNLKVVFEKVRTELAKSMRSLEILKEESIKLKRTNSFKEKIFLSLFVAAIFFAVVFICWTKVHSAINSKVCPRCFEFGTLIPVPGNNKLLQCTSKLCKDNTFRLPQRFQGFSKLSFPMIGCLSSGKTHWLLNIYSLNRKGSVSTKKKAALYKIDAIDNDEFDNRERDLAIQTSGGGSVQPNIQTATPPLIFALKDNKNLPLGLPDLLRSRGLSLCFDYAGELRQERYKDTQEMVSRSNGIVFFLDVMNVDKSQIDFTNWKNNKWVENIKVNLNDTKFQTNVIVGKTYADFIIARNLTEPSPLDIPVAICLSKIDLLPFQGPLKGTYGEKFLKELEECEHPPNRWSFSTIFNRSNIIRNYLPLIFANKGMIEIFDQKFGSNYMFFPVANRGLDPDLSFGEPFGVMEPLLWLQHMHGFNVLDS
jgi:hypothetical protein